MNVDIKPNLTVDTTELTNQRALIGNLVASLECGRTGIAIKRDLDALLGIQGTLDVIGNAAEHAASINHDVGPDCPGCTNPGDCEDCEYEDDDDDDLDPVCSE